MSKIQLLRAMINERLTAVVEDICGVFERTIAEYEEKVYRSKEENRRQAKLLDAILNPELRLNRTEEVPPEQQEWISSLGQEEPEPPHIKDDQEELVEGLEEAEVPTLTLLPEERHYCWRKEKIREAGLIANTSTEQMKTEPDGEDCGVSKPASNLDPGSLEQSSYGHPLSSDCCETEDSDDDWKETIESQSGLNALKSNKTQRVEGQRLSELKPSNQIPSLVGCKVCGESFSGKNSLMRHAIVHSRDCGWCGRHLEPRESLELHFQAHMTCSVCSKKCSSFRTLEQHMQVHTRQKPFSTTVCEKGFGQKDRLELHMRSHTGEKPFNCSVCGRSFVSSWDLHVHRRLHTGQKLFSCSICSKRFNHKTNLNAHTILHTREKLFSCSICSKMFSHKGSLTTHMRVHTREKQFSCSVCSKTFYQKRHLTDHTRVHTGEKPYSCLVCGKSYTLIGNLNRHKRVHTGEKP